MACTLVWLRNDLRLEDLPVLKDAQSEGRPLAFAVVMDPKTWAVDRNTGVPRMASHRARFWLESLQDMRTSLQSRQSELLVRIGDPAVEVPRLVRALGAIKVFCTKACAHDEAQDEAKVAQALGPIPLEATFSEPLLHLGDLPFELDQLPNGFTSFRKKVEKSWRVRPLVPAPDSLPLPSTARGLPPGPIPQLSDLGLPEPESDSRAVMDFRGGEAAAKARLHAWMFEADALRQYKETRNGLLEGDDSSKLSPWLALGCISPRTVYFAVQAYEAERVSNESTYWLVFELLWRDHFKFLALREGPRLFRRSGIGGRDAPWRTDAGRFEAWVEGRTGFPFVDAFMRELTATGFMSNRGRQNVASFLAKTLRVDWRWGAAHFERHLVDYDPCSNWGNWQYVAGVGTDPRDRTFNVVKQGKDYDPDGTFVRRWLPELEGIPDDQVHTPWMVPEAAWPDPVVPPQSAFRRS